MALSVIVLGTVSFADAQHKRDSVLESTVWVIGNSQDEEIVKVQAVENFRKTLRKGPQQVGMPKFMISDKSAKAIFAIGGFVNFRTAYDFNNVVGNQDFVTYDIPMTVTAGDRQRLLMDISTSRLYFKTLVNTRSLGQIEVYIETDFRGENNVLRLREAYVSLRDWLVGQTVTTFTDLEASPNTIDFEGPNAYTYGRNMMVRYRHIFNEHWSVAISAEMPELSATFGRYASSIPQRVPDIPAYVQYSWNKGASHLRASGIFRNMYYHNDACDKTSSITGWGAQLSSIWQIGKKLTLYGQVLYGEGISPYIQDIADNGLDLVPRHNSMGRLQTNPAFAWLAGAQYSITPKLAYTVGYSQVNLWNQDQYFDPSQYRYSQYVVTNMMYNISQSFLVGVEYLYGTRHDMNDAFGKANRVQAQVQFNF